MCALNLCEGPMSKSKLRSNGESPSPGHFIDGPGAPARCYTPEQLACILGVCTRTVLRSIARGEIRAIRLSRNIRIGPGEVSKILGIPSEQLPPVPRVMKAKVPEPETTAIAS